MELSPSVKRLLLALGSVQALEALLALERGQEKRWTAGQVAATLQVASSVERSLERLAQLNLVDVRLGNDVLYRYSPGSPELARAVQSLKQDYLERRLLVLEVLLVETMSPDSPLRTFAEAFRVRRKKDG